jgi:hypothetical protein
MQKITIIYWDPRDYRCDADSQRISRDDTKHIHCKTEQQVIKAFIEHDMNYHCGSDSCIKPATCLFHNEKRYWCITGPGGLVRSISFQK